MPFAIFQKPKEEEIPKPKEDTRFQDYISSIKGSEMPEEKPMSNTDRVKNVLGALGTTFALGAVGGNAAMNAFGDYQDRKRANAEKRRLEKISRAKELLGAERDIAAIKGSEKAGMLDEERIRAETIRRDEELRAAAEQARENQRQKALDRESKATEKAADREFESKENRLNRESHEKVSRAQRALAGSSGQSKEDEKTDKNLNPSLPFTPVEIPAPGSTVDPNDARQKRTEKISPAIGKIITEFKKAGVSDISSAKRTFNQLVESGQAFQGIPPKDLEIIYQQIAREFATPEQLAAYTKFKQQGMEKPSYPLSSYVPDSLTDLQEEMHNNAFEKVKPGQKYVPWYNNLGDTFR